MTQYDANSVYTDISECTREEILTLVEWYKHNLRGFDEVKSLNSMFRNSKSMPYLGVDGCDDIWTVHESISLQQSQFVPAKDLLNHINGATEELWFVVAVDPLHKTHNCLSTKVCTNKEAAVKEAEHLAHTYRSHEIKIGKFTETCQFSSIKWS